MLGRGARWRRDVDVDGLFEGSSEDEFGGTDEPRCLDVGAENEVLIKEEGAEIA